MNPNINRSFVPPPKSGESNPLNPPKKTKHQVRDKEKPVKSLAQGHIKKPVAPFKKIEKPVKKLAPHDEGNKLSKVNQKVGHAAAREKFPAQKNVHLNRQPALNRAEQRVFPEIQKIPRNKEKSVTALAKSHIKKPVTTLKKMEKPAKKLGPHDDAGKLSKVNQKVNQEVKKTLGKQAKSSAKRGVPSKSPSKIQVNSQSNQLKAFNKAEQEFLKKYRAKILHAEEGGDQDSDLFSKEPSLMIKFGLTDIRDSLSAQSILNLAELAHTIPIMKSSQIASVQSAQDNHIKYTILQDAEGREYAVNPENCIPINPDQMKEGSQLVYDDDSQPVVVIKKAENIQIVSVEVCDEIEGGKPDDSNPKFLVGTGALSRYLIDENNPGTVALPTTTGRFINVSYEKVNANPPRFKLLQPNPNEMKDLETLDPSIDFDKEYRFVQKEENKHIDEEDTEVSGDEMNEDESIDQPEDLEALFNSPSIEGLSIESGLDAFDLEDDISPPVIYSYLVAADEVYKAPPNLDIQERHWIEEFRNTPFITLSTLDQSKHYLVSKEATSLILKQDGKNYVSRNNSPYEVMEDGSIVGHEVPALVQEKVKNLWPGEGNKDLDIRKPSREREEFYTKINRNAFVDSFIGYMLTRSHDGKIVTLKKDSNFLFKEEPNGQLSIKQIDLDAVMPPSNNPSSEFVAHPLRCGLMGFPLATTPLTKQEVKRLHEMALALNSDEKVEAATSSIASIGMDPNYAQLGDPLIKERQDAYLEVVHGMLNYFNSLKEDQPASLSSLFLYVFPSYAEHFNALLEDNVSPEEAALMVGSEPRLRK